MNRKTIIGAVTALSVLGTAMAAVPASAKDWRHGATQRDNRHDRNDDRRAHKQQWKYYGGSYGYNGYRGKWRAGQRYPNYNQSRYVVSDYGRYGLPAPRQGYRYYRDNNGDVVMAAIATGVIGLIIGGALSGR